MNGTLIHGRTGSFWRRMRRAWTPARKPKTKVTAMAKTKVRPRSNGRRRISAIHPLYLMVHPDQNSSLRANWFCRGLLTVLEIVPAAVVPIDVFGNPKFGWLKILDDSV